MDLHLRLARGLQPGSFVALSAVAPNDYVARCMEMRYLSFMTLTTVGYGDIVPHSPATRTLAALEAVAGQIYLTVLVARLVGLHIVHADKGSAARQLNGTESMAPTQSQAHSQIKDKLDSSPIPTAESS